MKTFIKKFRIRIIAVAIVIAAASSYSFVDGYFEVSKNLDIFATLFRELNIYYVDETKPGDLMKKGIDEMLESLDPYTNFIPESEIEDHRYMITGQYGGIGSLIRQNGDYVIVSEPYEGYPAQKGDLRAGDKILEVNGVSVKGKKTDDLSKLLKGQPNTIVKLIIERKGEPKPLEKILAREEIKVKNVPYYGMITENTGYIKLSGFTENASEEVKDALLALKKNSKFKYLVFDLRDNGGGLLKESVEIVNLFINKGQDIVSTRGKVKEWDHIHKADEAPVDTETPIVVLVNRNTASASEIVSGAIQDLDRGVVIGQRTYGKGLVQQTRPLSYGSQLKLTVAKYYTPSGRCIQALDYSHRNEDGSVSKIPDSLITAFKTKNGRFVYDGGGIAPDVSLEPKKYSQITTNLGNKSLIFDYATNYRLEHPSVTSAKEFKLSDPDYETFVAWVNTQEFDYTTKSEKSLEDLKGIVEKEKYWENAKTEYEALKAKIMHNKKEDLYTFKSEIKELLEEEIVSRYYYQTGRLENAIQTDPEIKEALSVLRDEKRYKTILTTITKAEHPLFENMQKAEKTKTRPSKTFKDQN